MKYGSFILAALTFGLSSAAVAGPPRQPTGKWVVDYADTMCSAVRNFGTDEKPLVLGFRPSPSGKIVRIMVLRQGRGGAAHHFAVTSNVAGRGERLTGLRFTPTDKKSDVTWINVPRAAIDRMVEAGRLDLSASSGIFESFALPGIAGVVKALDTCNADLRAHWNIGEDSNSALPNRAKANLAQYVSDMDYPGQAISEGATGKTAFVLMVGEDGAVKDCMIEETSGVASLDAQSCAVLMKRAKFVPARDAAGNPARDVVYQQIIWRMR